MQLARLVEDREDRFEALDLGEHPILSSVGDVGRSGTDLHLATSAKERVTNAHVDGELGGVAETLEVGSVDLGQALLIGARELRLFLLRPVAMVLVLPGEPNHA